MRKTSVFFIAIVHWFSIGTAFSESADVAADVLFIVLGKMALYDQAPDGNLSLRNHHFVAEIMPREGGQIISGTLTSTDSRGEVLEFRSEGNAFLAHGARVMDPAELHRLHPDGEYIFSYETRSGRMESQPVTLMKRASIDAMPAAAKVMLSQGGEELSSPSIEPDADLTVSWQPMPGNMRAAGSDLNDLVFVLAFDCFGKNIAHSGRPYQGGPYLTFNDSQFTIAASSLLPGMKYVVIVEQATADVTTGLGVPSIATYATLTFVNFQTAGESQDCPVKAP